MTRNGFTLTVLAGCMVLASTQGRCQTNDVVAETPAIAVASDAATNNTVEAAQMIKMETSMGTIEIEMMPKAAPATVENFIQYVKDGFLDGTIFHRVIPGFVIQGGGFTPDMNQKKTRPTIKNEAKAEFKNLRGTLSMARTPDINSASSQFFVNLKDNESLDHSSDSPRGFGYAVFAKVVKGMDVVDKIAQVQTGSRGPYDDVPVVPVVVTRVQVVDAQASSSAAPASK